MEIKILNIRIILISLSFLSLLFIGACTELVDTKPTTQQLFHNRKSKQWINYSWKVNNKEQLRECEKTDVWTIFMSGKIVQTPGLIRCDIYQPDYNHSYFFAGDDDKTVYLKIKNGINDVDQIFKATIANISATDMKITFFYLTRDGSYMYNHEIFFRSLQ